MSRTAEGARLTGFHYRAQLALRALAVRDAAALWRMFSPRDRASWPRLLAAATPVLKARYGTSAGLSAAYFGRMSVAELGRAERPALGPALDDDRIAASLTATGLVGTIRSLSAGQSPQAALQNGFVRFQGSFSRLALAGGRETLLSSIQASPRATGYRRITSGKPCSFCSGLAGEESSPDAFAAHDSCSCTAEPAFA